MMPNNMPDEYQYYDIIIKCEQEASPEASPETTPVKITGPTVLHYATNIVLATIARVYFHRNKTSSKFVSYAMDFLLLLIGISVLLKIVAYFSDSDRINHWSNIVVNTLSVVIISLYVYIAYDMRDK
jgi:hypothetical protein